MMTIKVATQKKRQLLDITGQVESQLQGSGLVHVFTKHTAAAITTADLDPGNDDDILDVLATMTPKGDWRHPHDPEHFPDHPWASIIGPGVSVPFKGGKLQLGTWQRIILIELDGPRERQIEFTAVATIHPA